MGFKKEKREFKWFRSLLRHQLSWSFIVGFGLNKKVSCEGLLMGGDKVIWKFHIPMIMQSLTVKFLFNIFQWLSFGLSNIYSKDPRFNRIIDNKNKQLKRHQVLNSMDHLHHFHRKCRYSNQSSWHVPTAEHLFPFVLWNKTKIEITRVVQQDNKARRCVCVCVYTYISA